MVADEVVQGEGEGGDGRDDADGEGPVDRGPPAAVDTRVADEDQEGGAEEELGDAGDVEASRVREDGHGCGGRTYEGEI